MVRSLNGKISIIVSAQCKQKIYLGILQIKRQDGNVIMADRDRVCVFFLIHSFFDNADVRCLCEPLLLRALRTHNENASR